MMEREVRRIHEQLGADLRLLLEGNDDVGAAGASSVQPQILRPGYLEGQLVVGSRVASDPDPLALRGEVLFVGSAPRKRFSTSRGRKLRLSQERLGAGALPTLHLPTDHGELLIELSKARGGALAASEQPAILMKVPFGLLLRRPLGMQRNFDLDGSLLGVLGQAGDLFPPLDAVQVLRNELADSPVLLRPRAAGRLAQYFFAGPRNPLDLFLQTSK